MYIIELLFMLVKPIRKSRGQARKQPHEEDSDADTEVKREVVSYKVIKDNLEEQLEANPELVKDIVSNETLLENIKNILTSLFSEIDVNKDGELGPIELHAWLFNNRNSPLDESCFELFGGVDKFSKWAQGIIDKLDTDNNGSVSYEEATSKNEDESQ